MQYIKSSNNSNDEHITKIHVYKKYYKYKCVLRNFTYMIRQVDGVLSLSSNTLFPELQNNTINQSINSPKGVIHSQIKHLL